MHKKAEQAWTQLVKLARYAKSQQKPHLHEVDPDLILAVNSQLRGDTPPATAFEGINVSSMVASTDLRPCVIISWGNNEGELSPAEAADHALGVLEAAEAATADSFLWDTVLNKVCGGDMDKAAPIMRGFLEDFKAHREKHRSRHTGGPIK